MIVAAGVVLVLALLLVVSTHGRPASALGAALQVSALPDGSALLEAFDAPFPNASRAAWTRYVRLMATARPETVTADGRVGIFEMELRRLEDLGYVRNVRRVERDGVVSFEMEWRPPHSLTGFLGDGALQYQAFARGAADDRQKVLAQYRGVIGKTVAGKVVSLSGLLAVTHRAGIGGLALWLSGQASGAEDAPLTALYSRTNGLF